MNNIQVISNEPFVSNQVFLQTPVRANFLWKNLIIEKRTSIGRKNKFYKGGVLHAFWQVLSSPVS